MRPKKVILCVDDNEQSLSIRKFMLETRGYAVVACTNGNDALTGMEASLRFAGPESVDTKIFGRLTAWQNWIFQRPNAVGPQGALTNYGKPTQAQFDYKRT